MDDEEPHHGDGCPPCGRLRRPLVVVLGDDDGNDDVACLCTQVSFHGRVSEPGLEPSETHSHYDKRLVWSLTAFVFGD